MRGQRFIAAVKKMRPKVKAPTNKSKAPTPLRFSPWGVPEMRRLLVRLITKTVKAALKEEMLLHLAVSSAEQ